MSTPASATRPPTSAAPDANDRDSSGARFLRAAARDIGAEYSFSATAETADGLKQKMATV